MKSKSSPKILILGAHGMLGRIVFTYLSSKYPNSTWGTIKGKTKKNFLFSFNAHTLKELEIIYKQLGKIDYIINCIGILRSNTDEKEMEYINAVFPHLLAKFSEQQNSKLFHISTDAIFSSTEKEVNEDTPPSPNDIYEETKLKGEPIFGNVLTIRTSLIGLDPFNHKGLLEWILQAQSPIRGFANQIWSGCTTLQFAKLCELIITTNSFQNMRDVSSVFHFSPIVAVTKHDIIKTFLSLMKSNKKVIKISATPTTRLLVSKYPHLLFYDQLDTNLKDALHNLILFEKNYLSSYETK